MCEPRPRTESTKSVDQSRDIKSGLHHNKLAFERQYNTGERVEVM
jgi:hypothetical protein